MIPPATWGTWDRPETVAVETIRYCDHFCVRVSLDAPGAANNEALNLFGSVPVEPVGQE